MRQAKPLCRFLWILGAAIAIMLLFSFDLAAQCQMCRTALTQSPEGQRWARGINVGILLLLFAPFMIAGSIALAIYRQQIAAFFKYGRQVAPRDG